MRLRRFSEHIRAHDWFAVVVDFVIVVLGVYVAVWAAGLQAAHERQQRTKKAVAALRHDLRDAIDVEQIFDDKLDAAFAAFTAARQRGETPPPVYLRMSGSDTPPKSPCQGVLQTQLAELHRSGASLESVLLLRRARRDRTEVRPLCGLH